MMQRLCVSIVIAAILVCVASGASSPIKTRWYDLERTSYDFDRYKSEFGKEYSSPYEEALRRLIFQQNLDEIIKHNQKNETWKAGVNHLTDRSADELKSLRGYRYDAKFHPQVAERRLLYSAPLPKRVATADPAELPDNVDWRLKGAVTPVKDQGQCGSCWTFSASETVESHWFIKTGMLQELSEQQIASCTPNPHDCGGSGGCEGGTPEVAFQGIIDYGGHASEWTYPYSSWNGTDHVCRLNGTDPSFRFIPSAKLAGYVTLPFNDQNSLLNAVATIGPMAISVDARAWSSYESGVFSGCDMNSPEIDHNVQLVGYGVDSSLGNYWLVRNSWTPHWGESGYIRIARPDSATCGVDKNPCSGSACQPCPASQTVCGMCGILSDSSYPLVSEV